MDDILEMMSFDDLIDDATVIMHYGTKRHSGRYPYGSGEDPYQHEMSFLANVKDLRRNQGLTETEIASALGFKTTTELRAKISEYTQSTKAYQSSEAARLKAKGYSNVAIGERLGGLNESSVRLLLNPVMQEKRTKLSKTVDFLKEQVDKHGMVDTGSGVEQYMGITADALRKAVKKMELDGYTVHDITVPQLLTGKDTKLRVLAKPGTTYGDIMKHRSEVALPDPCYSADGGKSVEKLRPPVSIDPKRILVRYADQGGSAKDGMIELRPGVKDLDLGAATYAQVRIAVNGTHYIKGVAIRSIEPEKMPKGVDIIVNSNKKSGTPLISSDPDAKQVLKPMQADPNNPFGATIKTPGELKRAQAFYEDDDGTKKQSALNIVSEEGTWADWSRTLPSQFLGKQSPVVAKKQLTLQHDIMSDELKTIMQLTNPTVKREMLEEFAGKCGSAATHMAAAAFPRQSTRLLLPLTSIKENDIYCPGLNTGERVIAIRYPHAGIFEIPTLTVNNNLTEGKKLLGNAIDACGISARTAQQLSGADYDGDTATIIPIDNIPGIKVEAIKDELKNFDMDAEFPPTETSHRMTKRERNAEMGSVSNLITDMTIKGASMPELMRAVKHSMVVIDAYKHHYNYKLSEEVFGIKELKRIYQGGANAGASTLLSRATGDVHINQRKEKLYSRMTDEEKERWQRGEKIYEDTGATYSKPILDKEGNRIGYSKELKKEVISKMENAFDNGGDAYDLISGGNRTGERIERVYADYANSMKAMEREALAAARACDDIPYNPQARIVYKNEYDQLITALANARKNAPLERAAQIAANKEYSDRIKNDDGSLDAEKKKKLKSDIMKRARARFGAGKHSIYISDRQWEAINAGAVTKTVLRDILSNADKDRVKDLAMPRYKTSMSPAKVARAKQLLKQGYSQEDVSAMIGVSVTTMMNAVNE